MSRNGRERKNINQPQVAYQGFMQQVAALSKAVKNHISRS
jgi:hypothetical protein